MFSGFIQLPSSSGAYSEKVRAAAKISAGLWGAPREFYDNFIPRVTGPTVQNTSTSDVLEHKWRASLKLYYC